MFSVFEAPVTCCLQAWLCHRVGAAGGKKAAAGSLSGERGHGVCIREYLTPSQDAVYRKADETRHRRPDVILDCWTFRGRTFVRTSQDEVHEFNDADQFCSKETKTSSCTVMWSLYSWPLLFRSVNGCDSWSPSVLSFLTMPPLNWCLSRTTSVVMFVETLLRHLRRVLFAFHFAKKLVFQSIEHFSSWAMLKNKTVWFTG